MYAVPDRDPTVSTLCKTEEEAKKPLQWVRYGMMKFPEVLVLLQAMHFM